MPYFVYKILPGRKLVPVQNFDSFKDAKALARQMRASMTPVDNYTAKVIFAKNHEEAERLLTEQRERILREDD